MRVEHVAWAGGVPAARARRRARSPPARPPGGSRPCAGRRRPPRRRWPWIWRPRTFDWTPVRDTPRPARPARSWPAATVPVTTVPNPRIVKTRSIGRRKVAIGPPRRARRARAPRAPRAAPAAPRPSSPRRGGSGAPSRNVPRRKPRTSSWTSSSHSGSARSALVRTTSPALDAQQLADREMLARLRHHPLVGGDDQQDEVDAADARQHVLHEALVARARRRCRASARRASSRWAKPRSMVMPRAFSSLRRSVSMPVSAWTRRRLAVVDVAGGADDDVAHGGRTRRAPSRAAASERRPRRP